MHDGIVGITHRQKKQTKKQHIGTEGVRRKKRTKKHEEKRWKQELRNWEQRTK